MSGLLYLAHVAMIWERKRWLATGVLALALCLVGGATPARADRFSKVWQGEVIVDRAVVYSEADPASPPVGPLGKWAVVVVVDQVVGADGNGWTEITDGFLRTRELQELTEPWTAEVSVPSVSIRAYPDARSAIRRTGREGDLLRVTGVSKGINGDISIWWATTEGYLPMRTLRWATNDWAGWWSLPGASEAPQGWWGTVQTRANVRAAPGSQSPIVGTFAGGERVKVLSEEHGEEIDGSDLWYRLDGGRYAGGRVHSAVVARIPEPKPNSTAPPGDTPPGPWIVVDRAAKTLTLVKDSQPVFTTYVSIGRAGVATPRGTYSTFGKFIADRMTSAANEDADHQYDLPNVPFTQYYLDGGYAIHGTYWHDVFGTAESQGCINLTRTDAAYLFTHTRPRLFADALEAWEPSDPPATPVVILD